ncbi:MAG: S1C family serine protease [Tenericutes bacterium]|nr:S1C family serine protease [Mycoplasmatota bacterium]
MKKLMMLIMILSVLLSGCTVFVVEEDTEEFKILASQYQNYVANDINIFDQFQSFINVVTLDTAVSSVMIEVKVYSPLGVLLEIRYGSGVLFEEDSTNYHILTTYELTDLSSGQTISIEVSDYLGRTYRGFVRKSSEELGLTGIRFAKNKNRVLQTLDISESLPLIGEPVMLIGYQGEIINALTMGLITDYIRTEDDIVHALETNVLSDALGNGGVLVNMNHEIIGIQYDVSNGSTFAYSIYVLNTFIDYYLQP